jgi:hypothetical protein
LAYISAQSKKAVDVGLGQKGGQEERQAGGTFGLECLPEHLTCAKRFARNKKALTGG